MMYEAPDGTKFEDQRKYKLYMFDNFYTFKNKKGETLVKKPGEIDGQPFNLEHLDNCEVRLMDHSDQIQVDFLTNCKVLIGPSCESVFVRDCSDCEFSIACKQLRTRDCHRCTIYLYSLTDPVIETSSLLKIAPFNASYKGLTDQFRQAHLDPNEDHWIKIFDFNKDDDSIPQPHWCLLDRPSFQEWKVPIDGQDPETPLTTDLSALPTEAQAAVPSFAGAAVPDGSVTATADGGSMQSFSIHMGQEAAQQMVDLANQETICPPPMQGPGGIVRHDPVTKQAGRVRMHQAVVHNGVAYLSGQVGNPEHIDVAVQTVEILEKIEALLVTCGSDKSHILQASIFLADMRDFTQMNAVWDAWVDQENAPARTCIESRLASPQLLVEITVTAALT